MGFHGSLIIRGLHSVLEAAKSCTFRRQADAGYFAPPRISELQHALGSIEGAGTLNPLGSICGAGTLNPE